MDMLIKIVADWLMIPLGLLAIYGFVWVAGRHNWLERMKRVVMAGLTSYVAAKIIALLYQPAAL